MTEDTERSFYRYRLAVKDRGRKSQVLGLGHYLSDREKKSNRSQASNAASSCFGLHELTEHGSLGKRKIEAIFSLGLTTSKGSLVTHFMGFALNALLWFPYCRTQYMTFYSVSFTIDFTLKLDSASPIVDVNQRLLLDANFV